MVQGSLESRVCRFRVTEFYDLPEQVWKKMVTNPMSFCRQGSIPGTVTHIVLSYTPQHSSRTGLTTLGYLQ